MTGGEAIEREKWNVTTKLCELNSFYSKKERKNEVTSQMAYLKALK